MNEQNRKIVKPLIFQPLFFLETNQRGEDKSNREIVQPFTFMNEGREPCEIRNPERIAVSPIYFPYDKQIPATETLC